MTANDTNVRVQVAKNAAEYLTGRVVTRFGESAGLDGMARTVQQWFGTSLGKTLLGAGSIGAAALINVDQRTLPESIRSLFASFGLNGSAAAEIVNEVIDTAIRRLPETVAEHMDEAAIKEHVKKTADEVVSGTKASQFKALTPNPKAVPINIATHQVGVDRHDELHALDCPNCIEKRGSGKKTPTQPRFGGNIIAVARGIEIGTRPDLNPTTNNCCGPRIRKIAEAARKKLMKLDMLASGLGGVEGEWYDDITSEEGANEALTDEQRSELDRIRALDVWEESDREFLRQSIRISVSPDGHFNGATFIRRLHGKVPAPPDLADMLKQKLEAGGKTADLARGAIKKVTDALRETAEKQQRTCDILDDMGL